MDGRRYSQMKLLDIINQNITDEKDADDGYNSMIEAVKAEDGLTDAEKSLILGILFKIETDEETHQTLLKIIKDVLEKGDKQ